jgi:hypothetical protein
MSTLYVHEREISSIFQLLGEYENDATYSLGWTLSRCPTFLDTFVKRVAETRGASEGTIIRLQHFKRKHFKGKSKAGYTDIELELPGQFYYIVEAKIGWNLPSKVQLDKYKSRFAGNSAQDKRFVVLSECSQEYALSHLECRTIAGIPVQPLSWKVVCKIARNASVNASHSEKRLIAELLTYLGGIMSIQDAYSNKVYIVSLGSGTPPGWGISWIDIVRRRRRYFHPVGTKGWPKEPPNYIAFRYGGKLQSIHHIDSYEVITTPHERMPEIPRTEVWEPHYLYRLGRPFAPAKEVPNGKIYVRGRYWCMLDALFTCRTVRDARDLTQKREKQGESA